MYKILKEGEKLTFLITAALLTELLAKQKMDPKQKLAFATATDNGNSIGVEQIADTEKGEAKLLVTARESGYAAVTTIVSQKDDGRVLAVFGQQFYVASPEAAASADTMPVGASLNPFVGESSGGAMVNAINDHANQEANQEGTEE